MRANFSIRTKLLLVSLLLLLIPWMSYVYVRDMKSFLLSGQEDALSFTSRAIATVLHDRPELFTEASHIEANDSVDDEIYVFPLPNYINLDGNLSDWGEQVTQAKTFNANSTETVNPNAAGPVQIVGADNSDISVNHLLGYHGRFIYAFFEVTDDQVLFRKKGFLRVDSADHIRVTLQDPAASRRRFTLIAREAGRMSVYLMDDKWQYPITGQPNFELAAELIKTAQGYNVELRIPRFILSSDTRIQLSVADVDDPQTLAVEDLVTTTSQRDDDNLPNFQVQPQQLARILEALDRSDTRIWVINQNKVPLGITGKITTEPFNNHRAKPVNSGKNLDYAVATIRYYYNSALNAIFNFIVDERSPSSDDEQSTIEERNDRIIDQALAGEISTGRSPSLDNQGTILMSAHPVLFGDSILGAVIVEQSTNQVLQRQQSVLENIISVTLLVLLTVVAALLLFASRLTVRIRRLRNATDNAIDRDGRIINQKLSAEAKSGDEIGDLSRSVSNMLGRLSQYTKYLRGLPDTLAHEVSNPLNVVNSSLHNLAQENPSVAQSKYLERATNGVNRIGAILRNLTEAANLEQAMQSETREVFDVVELIENYVDGYSISNPEQKFDVVIHSRPLQVEAAPDYIAQVLDKLVDNAIDFAAPETAIVFKVQRIDRFVQIDVINQGSRLPEGMSERIFEPLVSLGRKDAQKSRLGMGLYVVKLIASFHGGDVIARNLSSSDGVIFSFSLPIHNPEPYGY
ncbi:MAG: two-component system sensor histidine kinase ChvG [Arenicella sp.]|jgi:two-component system sensor histidine kinase ChvG